MRTEVVLPAPLGPSSPRTDPASTSMSMPFSASTLPKRRSSCSVRMMGPPDMGTQPSGHCRQRRGPSGATDGAAFGDEHPDEDGRRDHADRDLGRPHRPRPVQAATDEVGADDRPGERLEAERGRHERGADPRPRDPPPVAEVRVDRAGYEAADDPEQVRVGRRHPNGPRPEVRDRDAFEHAVGHREVAGERGEHDDRSEGDGALGALLCHTGQERQDQPWRRHSAHRDGPPAEPRGDVHGAEVLIDGPEHEPEDDRHHERHGARIRPTRRRQDRQRNGLGAPVSGVGSTTIADRVPPSPTDGDGRITRQPPTLGYDWQYDELVFWTHIVVDPPPSRLTAVYAPAAISWSARNGRRAPIDQFVLFWRPSTVIRISLHAVLGFVSEHRRRSTRPTASSASTDQAG